MDQCELHRLNRTKPNVTQLNRMQVKGKPWKPSEWVECPAGIAAQIMGHKPSATAEKHYRHRPLDLLRMWHVKIEKWTLEQAGIKQPEEESGKLRLAASN